VRAVDDRSYYFFTAVGWQAVHEYRVRAGATHQFLRYLIGAERSYALNTLFFLSHRHPHIGIHRMRSLDRSSRIFNHRRAR
jgi:hypothetical protein